MIASLLAHHIGVEIMGTEYEPHGMLQHAVVFGASIVFFGLAGVGFVTVCRRIAAKLRGKGEAARA